MTDKNNKLLKRQLKKVIPNHRVLLSKADITLELLQDASMVMAQIVEKYGDLYIPIFARVIDEIEDRKKNQSYKEIALQMLDNEQ
ncbi:MAG: hypothetical protein AAF849_00735 [Bacteroidota bacterium]